MAEFMELIKKDSNVKNDISQNIENYRKQESISTQSKIGQIALMQSSLSSSNRYNGWYYWRYVYRDRAKKKLK